MADDIDDLIVGVLLEDGRASFAQIAGVVGLSAHAVAERVRRLESRGTILGYTARVNQQALGRSLAAYVDVRLLPTTDPERFEKLALGLTATQAVTFVTGRFDYIIQLACRDTNDLDKTVRELRKHGGVAATETRIVMRKSELS